MKKVMLAIGDKNYTDILKEVFQTYEDMFELSREVLHRNFLDELIEEENPDILILHDYYLPTNFTTQSEKDRELINLVRKWQITYDNKLRVVFLCERPTGDPLLSTLVSIGVRDIFNSKSFNIDQFIQQLIDEPHFSNVEKFLIPEQSPISNVRNEKNNEGETKKTVEKKVIQKNVIKREYLINVTNNLEKVVGIPIERKIIFIASPFSRSGCTFVSHLLAREIAKMGVSITYIENPFGPSYTFDRFIGHQFHMNYRSKFFKLVDTDKKQQDFTFDWNFEGVNIIAKHPQEGMIYNSNNISFEQFIKIILSTNSAITILDVGTDWNLDVYRDLYDISSLAYFIIEPDISNIQYLEDPDNEQTADFRKILSYEKSHLIGNRFDMKIIKNPVIQNIYKDRLQIVIPEFSSSDVLEVQYQGNFLNDSTKFSETINKFLYPLIKDILPNEFLKKYTKQNRFLKRLFNKKVEIQRK